MLDDVSTTTYNATANTFLEFKFTKELSLKTSFGANIYEDRSKNYQNNKYGDAANVKGRTTIASDRQISYTLNQVFSWDKEFGNHAVKLLAGHEHYYLKYAQQSASGINNRYNDLNELDNDSAISSQPSSSEDNHRIESYFGGLNYDYKSKYLFSASVRRDGSSRFAPENRWGTFYSVGAGWRLSEEVFLKNVKWINELKLKASYGEQGNENLGNGLDYYLYQPWYVANGEGGYNAITRRVNRDVKWEGNNVTNIGVEFTLFKRKLQGSLEYFTRTTKDMLFEVPLPATSGYLSQYKNVGTLRNYGIELSLGYNAVQKKNFDWRIDLNLTSFKNEVLSMPVEFNKTGGIVSGTKKISVGRSIYEFWLREYAGVDAATGKALYFRDVLDSKKVPTGERILTDNPSDASFYYFGTSIPKFSGGLTNSFRFKNILLII